jgi:CRISPR-associated endonuclease/helicase Cas3
MYAAHITDNKKEQSVKEHLVGVAEICRKFGSVNDFGELAYLCGILHDIGKYSEKFQQHIHGNFQRVDHSTAGAKTISQLLPCGPYLAYCVAGHHSGLPNGGTQAAPAGDSTLQGRLKKAVEPYDTFKSELNLSKLTVPRGFPITLLDNQGFSFSFAIRMLYSILVDADFLDTEHFMSNGIIERDGYLSITELGELLNRKLQEFQNPTLELNQKRSEILNQCIEKANQSRNLFTLTVPTGAGKTFASLAFALQHAKRNEMTRIIYVIPYTSIIEQNAREFKKVLGDANVLEHHSNFDYKEESDSDVNQRQRLACENWNSPVVVTTNVQFFESLFASHSSRCRKLHNISNSVIIFDEAQMLPTQYLKPCVYAIAELVKNYKCTAVLCSATQPALQGLFPKNIDATEIIDETDHFYNFFKRTEIVRRGQLTNEMLTEEINKQNQVLCIVNTKKHAQDLFGLLTGEGTFHLSALMCPKHRTEKIELIKQRLARGESCKVISTQIIEAGVDVDFPVLYRSMAGLDELIQAAGRCNREGKLPALGQVHVFEPEEDYCRRMPAVLKRPISITESIMRNYQDIISPQAIKAFFSELYESEGNNGLDVKNIMKTLQDIPKTESIPFKEIEEEFHLIEKNTKTIIIPYDKYSEDLIHKLKFIENPKGILRSLQPYTVSVYENQYATLLKSHAIQPVFDEVFVLLDVKSMYSDNIGLKTVLETGQAVFM